MGVSWTSGFSDFVNFEEKFSLANILPNFVNLQILTIWVLGHNLKYTCMKFMASKKNLRPYVTFFFTFFSEIAHT